jgi:hypothetical protein
MSAKTIRSCKFLIRPEFIQKGTKACDRINKQLTGYSPKRLIIRRKLKPLAFQARQLSALFCAAGCLFFKYLIFIPQGQCSQVCRRKS